MLLTRIIKPTVPTFAYCPRLTWSPGLVRRVTSRALSGEEDQRSIDDWMSSEMDARIQHTIDGVKSYCSRLPDDSKASENCWDSYQYLIHEIEEAEESCTLDAQGGCEDLDHWKDFIRQVESSGGPAVTIRTLQAIAKAHKRENNNIEPLIQLPEEIERTSRRKAFADFFIEMDRDRDGRLNAEEFRASMKKLGDELHGPTITTIFQSLDLHGYLDLDQFLTVVEAEEIRSHSELAGIMRVSAQHLQERQHKWWSSMD